MIAAASAIVEAARDLGIRVVVDPNRRNPNANTQDGTIYILPFSCYDGNRYSWFYDILHEIGHVILGHPPTPRRLNDPDLHREEAEASHFALVASVRLRLRLPVFLCRWEAERFAWAYETICPNRLAEIRSLAREFADMAAKRYSL